MLPYERLKYNKKHRTDGHQSLVVGKVFSTDVASSSLTVSEREKKAHFNKNTDAERRT